MSQKKDNSPSNLEKIQTRLAGECDACLSLANLNGQTHVSVIGLGENIAAMLANELVYGEHKKEMGALIMGAVYLACINDEEVYAKFSDIFDEIKQINESKNNDGQTFN